MAINPESAGSARKTLAHSRTLKVLELLIAGHAIKDIAPLVGITESAVRRAYKRAMKAQIRESADELRTIHGGRLDAALRAIWPNVIAGNLEAIQTFLKIAQRQAALFGLDLQAQTFGGSGASVVIRIEAPDAPPQRIPIESVTHNAPTLPEPAPELAQAQPVAPAMVESDHAQG